MDRLSSEFSEEWPLGLRTDCSRESGGVPMDDVSKESFMAEWLLLLLYFAKLVTPILVIL